MSRAVTRVGPYEVLGELGRGGLGAVYRARHPGTGGEVALKVLLDPQPQAATRFEREARAAARLRHPGIVPVHDLGYEGTRPYLVMELVEGESLSARVKRGPLEQEEAARLTREVADALACAHEVGILHRDVKPANVLVDRFGRARLTDFGLAREQVEGEQRLTRTGVLMGTPGYMAPEQVDDASRVGPPADVYGLGATFYELLTGSPPFPAGSLANLLKAVLTRPPTPPSELRPGLDPALEQLCLACLAKEPAERPTAAALSRALATWRPARAARRALPAAWIGAVVVVSGGLGALAVLLAAPGPAPQVAAGPSPQQTGGPPPVTSPGPSLEPAPPAWPEPQLSPEPEPQASQSPEPPPPPAPEEELPPEPYPGYREQADAFGYAYGDGLEAWVPLLRRHLERQPGDPLSHPEDPLWEALRWMHTPDGWKSGLPYTDQLRARGLTTALEHKVVAAFRLEAAQDAAGCLAHLERAWELAPEMFERDDNYFHFYGDAVMRALSGQPAEQERRLRWAIEHNRAALAPNRRYHLFYLARALQAQGRQEGALELLELAWQQDPNYPQANWFLGDHHRDAGDLARARDYYRRGAELAEAAIASLDPTNPFVGECTDVARTCRAELARLEGR